MKHLIYVVALSLAPFTSSADEPITNPIRYTWIATSCNTWNCAAAALVMANGNQYVIALPTGRDEHPWIILRRVEEGSVYVPEEEPYRCSVFTTVAEAAIELAVIDSCRAPMILNVPDGRAVIASLASCDDTTKRRAVR